MKNSAPPHFSLEKLLLDCVNQAVVATDLAGRIISWNRFAEDVYGWTAEEAFGRELVELMAADREASTAMLARAQRGEPWSGQIEFQRKSGRPLTAWLKLSCMRDESNAIFAIVMVSHQMLERRRDADGEADSSRPKRTPHARDLERRAAEKSTIAALANLALNEASSRYLMREAVEALRELFVADACEIFRGTGETFMIGAESGWTNELRVAAAIEPQTHAEYAVTSDEPVVFESLLDETRFAVPQQLVREGISSGVLVRMATASRITGVIGLYWRAGRACPADGVETIIAAANVIAQAIAREDSQKQLDARLAQQSAIAELSRLALNELGQQTLDRACELVMSALDVDYSVYIERIDGDPDHIIARAGHGWLDGAPRLVNIDGSQSGDTFRTRTTNIVSDYATEDRFNTDRFVFYGIRSGITVPVSSARTTFGVLTAQSRRSRAFDEADTQFMQSIANVLAEAMERDHSRAETRAADARYREVFEGAGEIIFTVAQDTTFTALNPAFEAITGYPVADWLGRKAVDIIAVEDQKKSGEMLDRVRCGDSTPFELTIITSNRDRRVIEISAFKKASGEEVYGFGRDVTERNRIARDLNLLLESTEEGIYVVDSDRKCTLANRAAARLLGYSQGDLVGRDMHALIHAKRADGSPYPGEDCPIYGPASVRVSGIGDEVFWRRDGSALPVEYSSASIVDQGVIRGRVVIFRDVTERRRLETQLDWAQRLASLGRLAATIAHEFNNVLMGISPFVEVLRRDLPSNKPNVTVALDHMMNAIRRGKSVTSDILRFARPAEPVLTSVRLRKLLEPVALEAGSVLPSACKLHIDHYDARLRVSADANQIHQVLTNLILNARDAMDGKGEITISAMREAPGARFPFGTVARPERFVHIAVSDTGGGIPPERVEQIFEPLFTTKSHGTGLGLALAHRVVIRHGGHIFVESRVGNGSTFHVFLPLSSTPTISESEDSVATADAIKRVLIVDDDLAVAAGLSALLDGKGIAVDVVNTGGAVMDAIEKRKPDAVILDVGLPDIDGTQVYVGIADRHPRLPVIFSTGHADESRLRPFLTRRGVQYLLKPYDGSALIECLDRCAAAIRSE